MNIKVEYQNAIGEMSITPPQKPKELKFSLTIISYMLTIVCGMK